jgi:hypothetical protein
MITLRKKIILTIFLFITSLFICASESELLAFKRIALFIGSNYGGNDRVTLLYAVSDAENMYNVMQEIGGISPEDAYLLKDPDLCDLEECLQIIKDKITDTKDDAKRIELFFYYSGHSDENGLLLGSKNYSF